MNFSKEMIKKAKNAASAEELTRMAAEEGIELAAEEAEQYFDFLHSSGTLSDEELESVAGGKGHPDPKYKAGQRVRFLHPDGTVYFGTIQSSYWLEFQQGFYYWVLMDNGAMMQFPLEDPYCPAKVIS